MSIFQTVTTRLTSMEILDFENLCPVLKSDSSITKRTIITKFICLMHLSVCFNLAFIL